jgi:hypothetical protein
MFTHRNVHKYTWTTPDGKTHTQIEHILIDRSWNSSTYIQNFSQHPTIKVNSICRGNDWGSSMWIIDFKKAYDSVRREILYNILIEFGIPMKLVMLIKMCLNETYTSWPLGWILTSQPVS